MITHTLPHIQQFQVQQSRHNQLPQTGQSPSYNAGKLCTEDPVSVSRKFSMKFPNSVEKGRSVWYSRSLLLEPSTGHHTLLWIKDATVIDKDDPDDVLKWIQERIT